MIRQTTNCDFNVRTEKTWRQGYQHMLERESCPGMQGWKPVWLDQEAQEGWKERTLARGQQAGPEWSRLQHHWLLPESEMDRPGRWKRWGVAQEPGVA